MKYFASFDRSHILRHEEKQLGLRNSLVYKREPTSIAIILFEYFIMSFPCVICYNDVRPRQHALECDSCQSWQNISYRFNCRQSRFM
jgi:hypothetical protein